MAQAMAETSTALPPEIAPEVPSEVLEQALAQAAEDTAAPDANQEEAAEARPEPVPAAAEIALAPEVAPEVLDLPPVAGATVRAAMERGIALAPERFDIVEIGTTVARYMRGEGEAAVAHLRALSSARSPAEIIRLQVGEAQRAADASLTCWVTVIGKASRVVAFR
ncbi:MAG: hypothetical protein INR63_27640 [Actinomycetospora chiangmaiensis]|nr:hypothetical protein [Actinomycetospora chiangmaiensis]